MLSEDLDILITEASRILSDRQRTKNDLKRLAKKNNAKNRIQMLNEDIIRHNSSALLIPKHHRSSKKINASVDYLPALLMQDWSHLFPEDRYDCERKYYVYAHINPKLPRLNAPDDAGGIYEGTPFYIGKGTGERAYDLKRNQGHGKMLEKLLGCGVTKNEIVKIIFNDLTEAKAYEIESKLIYFFGTIYGHAKGSLYNLDVPKIPKFTGDMIAMKFVIDEPDTEQKVAA